MLTESSHSVFKTSDGSIKGVFSTRLKESLEDGESDDGPAGTMVTGTGAEVGVAGVDSSDGAGIGNDVARDGGSVERMWGTTGI